MWKFASLLLFLTSCTTALAQAPQPPANKQVDLPVTKVVLFSSGVGYFQHLGNVSGDGSAELRFKTDQINDVLKSLVLEDLGGGSVSTITYPSQDPLSKTLKSFQVDIAGNPPLADLLNQLRGAKVSVSVQAEKIGGTILGVEKKQKSVGDKGEPIEVSVLNLLDGATIRSIELDSISSLSLEDAELGDELNRALLATAQSRDQDKKPVTINFSGKGDRQVRIGYVVETPVWKTSYRLVLGDKSTKLQGWAIVENQTDSDWSNVSLSLVSGRPISFVMDLYQPIYIPRPVVMPQLYASLRPQEYDAGMSMAKAADQQALAPQAAANLALQGQLRDRAAGLREDEAVNGGAAGSTFLNMVNSVQTIASAAKLGELFQYTIDNVNLSRQKSAMLPIVGDDVGVEKLSIYNAAVLPRNPLNGARVKNTTGKHLLQGPITVFDSDSYAGDAQIDDVPPGQQRLISYGIDLQMLIDSTKNSSEDTILAGKIVKGVLEISRKHVASRDYIAENKSDKDKTLIVEHPIRDGWKLVDTQAPIETTDSVYRFQNAVAAGKSTTLTVKEQLVDSETIALLSSDSDQIDFYSKSGEIGKDVRDALVKAMQLKQTLADTQQQIDQHNQQLAEITVEQQRIRENMKTVNQQSQYYQRLLTKLNDQESQIEKLQSERDDLMKKHDQQSKDLGDYLNGLSVG